MDISVIIATRNRQAMLRQTLLQLRAQESDGLRWEVIVVNNGSTDRTNEVLAEASTWLPVEAIDEPRPGKNRALNRALSVACGDLCLFTDDDVVACPRWVRSHCDAAQRWPNDNVFAGPIVPRFPPSTPEWLRHPDFAFTKMAFGRYGDSDREGPTSETPFGANLSIRAQIFQQFQYCESVGPRGTNYVMGSESELLGRLKTRGERFIYVPNAPVEHVIVPHQTTNRWLRGRAYRAGRGYVRKSEEVDGKWLFGSPRYLWRELAAAWMMYAASVPKDRKARCIAGMKLNYIRGMISEHRRLQREITGEKNGSASMAPNSIHSCPNN